ncbi:MAG: hypothetical protein BWX88_02771 [Planctomycetes bacterium ADurb.Bin126]|nr:MAG: hypothetical protein BWX88_02771 [Planctomycetes bacterium ADurb.Bin126]HOD79944.1 hypothetical protein [Phycisphaerae bacterium]HQL73241.1 hypothetical protein [Phycisphaerae bacterium]
MIDPVTLHLLQRAHGDPIGPRYNRAPQRPPGGDAFDNRLRVGRIINGVNSAVTPTPSEFYHRSSGVLDGWYFEEIDPSSGAVLEAPDTYANWLRLPTAASGHDRWFPMPAYQRVLFEVEYDAVNGWECRLVAPNLGSAAWLCVLSKSGYSGSGDDDTAGRGGLADAGPPKVFETCTWIYDVYDLFGNLLAEDLAPQRPRLPNTAYYYAGESGRSDRGLAYWLGGGSDIVLLDTFGEQPYSSECA